MPLIIRFKSELVLVRIYQTSVGVEPLCHGPECRDDELAALGDRVGAVGILLDGARLDLLVETLFECAVISYILGCEYFSDGFLSECLITYLDVNTSPTDS